MSRARSMTPANIARRKRASERRAASYEAAQNRAVTLRRECGCEIGLLVGTQREGTWPAYCDHWQGRIALVDGRYYEDWDVEKRLEVVG